MSNNATNPLAAVKPRSTQDLVFLVWDISIIVLVSLNLILILIDTLFVIRPLAGFLETIAPVLHGFYDSQVHENFVEIDLIFVAIFILDVVAGWTVAIVQRRYDRWWIYPFAHWYDVLGCIPVAGFRILRVLRLITIGFRLQKLGVIDVRNWTLFQILAKYYGIFIEEISDRVVINVLSGVQDEVRSGGGHLPQKVVREVVAPRKQKLISTISGKLQTTMRSAYDDNRQEIHDYVAVLVRRAVEQNALAKNVERVPVLGSYLTDAIDDTITDSVCDVLEEGINSLGSDEYEALVAHITDSVFDMLLQEKSQANDEFTDALVEIIDLLKDQVAVRRWKLPDA